MFDPNIIIDLINMMPQTFALTSAFYQMKLGFLLSSEPLI